MFYIVLYIVRSVLLIDFVDEKIELLIGSFFLIIASCVAFLIVSTKNPGYVEKENSGVMGLIDVYRSEFICGYCEVKKSHWTRHCHICQKCVKVSSI